jgi:hypothetical protein
MKSELKTRTLKDLSAAYLAKEFLSVQRPGTTASRVFSPQWALRYSRGEQPQAALNASLKRLRL